MHLQIDKSIINCYAAKGIKAAKIEQSSSAEGTSALLGRRHALRDWWEILNHKANRFGSLWSSSICPWPLEEQKGSHQKGKSIETKVINAFEDLIDAKRIVR